MISMREIFKIHCNGQCDMVYVDSSRFNYKEEWSCIMRNTLPDGKGCMLDLPQPKAGWIGGNFVKPDFRSVPSFSCNACKMRICIACALWHKLSYEEKQTLRNQTRLSKDEAASKVLMVFKPSYDKLI